MSHVIEDDTDTEGLSIVLRHLEHTDRRELDRAAADCAPDVRIHGLCSEPIGSGVWKQAMHSLLTAFPDGRFAVEDVLADGDRVAVRQTFRGTQEGAFLGIAPTGRRVTVIADQDEDADAVSARERLGGQRQQVAAVTRRADVAQRLATATRGCKPHFVGGARGRAVQHNGNLVVVRVVLASDQPHAASGQCVGASAGRAEPARIRDAAQAC